MTNNGENLGFDMAKAIWDKSYDSFAKYFDLVWDPKLTYPEIPNGAGVYKLDKEYGAKAVEMSRGKVVRCLKEDTDSVNLETEEYEIGTGIKSDLLRDAKGFVEKDLTEASNVVLTEVCRDIVNGLVNGAFPKNTQAVGVSHGAIEDAKMILRDLKTANGIKFGEPTHIVFSTKGWHRMEKSVDFEVAKYLIGREGIKVVETDLISAQKNSKEVHAIVLDRDKFAAFLRETDMDTYYGRLPAGTAGDKEIIQTMDAGMVITNSEAGVVITEA